MMKNPMTISPSLDIKSVKRKGIVNGRYLSSLHDEVEGDRMHTVPTD